MTKAEASQDTSIPKIAAAVDISSTDFDCTTAQGAAPFARRITVMGAGDLVVKLAGAPSTAITYKNCPAGFQQVMAVQTVVKSGTTATNMVAEA